MGRGISPHEATNVYSVFLLKSFSSSSLKRHDHLHHFEILALLLLTCKNTQQTANLTMPVGILKGGGGREKER